MATGDEPIFQCARDVVRVILDEPSPTLEALSEVLDRLAVAYATAPPGGHSRNAGERPRRDLRQLIAARFPQLGFYSDVYPLDPDFQRGTGDGIYDLVDIVQQMLELQWILDEESADDALQNCTFSHGIGWDTCGV